MRKECNIQVPKDWTQTKNPQEEDDKPGKYTKSERDEEERREKEMGRAPLLLLYQTTVSKKLTRLDI